MNQIYMCSALGQRKLRALSASKEYTIHSQREEIDRRIKIIKFFDKHGAKVTKEAFGVCRSSVYLWKSKLKESGGRLISLAPVSKAPIKKRKTNRNPQLVAFIKEYRNEHPNTGQEAIKPALDKYCKEQQIVPVSVPTIARILKELKSKGEIEDSIPKTRFHGSSGTISITKKQYRKKIRRKGYQPHQAGDLIQIDSITIFVKQLKRYIITAVDIKTKFAFAYSYERLTSESALDFMRKLESVAPFAIKRIQTDNGHEFEHLFRDYIARNKIVHFHNYPRNPQANACVERFNRTIQEQFVWRDLCLIDDLKLFNFQLVKYLIWYNTERRHQTIRAAPLDFFLDNFIHNRKKSNMLRDCTYNVSTHIRMLPKQW